MDHQQLPAPLPAPAVRVIGIDDFFKAFDLVKITGLPIPDDAPEVEGTTWDFTKADSTGNDHWDWIKRQCYNKSNELSNNRRDILPLLKNKRAHRREIARLGSQLKDLEQGLRAKILDFDQFVLGGFTFPSHFDHFPALKEKGKKKK
ncbi:hypothetical protein CFC21_104450 [Triticum aestivum]|uniref:Uncharacterized protein n=2 Tax=Triticum aestivum TaxID=4565 RepID=A0A3B6SHU8_WHEAT|nr:uncharacterized protein LOC119340285 [Triticum dicoccoides]XP_044430847.1 uncharacterized protein LOC123156739 [Triticum aestivum]KAF7103462.1 hypothetical protein CFC21_104450 [Triticum aestivum]